MKSQLDKIVLTALVLGGFAWYHTSPDSWKFSPPTPPISDSVRCQPSEDTLRQYRVTARGVTNTEKQAEQYLSEMVKAHYNLCIDPPGRR